MSMYCGKIDKVGKMKTANLDICPHLVTRAVIML